MAAITSTILAAAGVIGTGIQIAGALEQNAGQQQAIKNQQAAEGQRMAQMNIESDRRRREIVRQAQIARAQALTMGTAQGQTDAGSTALPTVESAQSAQAANQTAGVTSAQITGQNMFGYNIGASNGYRRAAMGGTMASIGGGIINLGGAISNSYPQLSRITNNFGFSNQGRT